MKNKIASIILLLILMTSLVPSFASSQNPTLMNIKIRIEGISQNFYYETIAIPYTTNLTVKDALVYADSQSSDITVTITGGANSYVSDINGDSSATFGGYDGWMYNVNSIEPTLGIDGYNLKEGDSLLLYYGDPYGAGMQFPIVDNSKISQGIIKFTSSDTIYDELYNPTVTINPIVGATVTWYYDNTSATYTTSANGEVTIPQAQLIAGAHCIQIQKYGTTASSGKYVPLVLRLSPDALVSVSAAAVVSPTPTNSPNPTTAIASTNPQTTDTSVELIVLLLVLSLISFAMIMKKKDNASIK